MNIDFNVVTMEIVLRGHFLFSYHKYLQYIRQL